MAYPIPWGRTPWSFPANGTRITDILLLPDSSFYENTNWLLSVEVVSESHA